MKETLVHALARRIVPYLDAAQNDLTRAIAAPTDDGVIGSLLNVRSELQDMLHLVDAALTLHKRQ